jgi:RNA polymerase sigma factor (sigma-70 family)
MSASQIPSARRSHRVRQHLGASFPEVLDAARADAPWAYQRLYAAYGGPVATYLRAQGAEDPDSLTNDVFLRAFGNVANFEGDEARFRSWLFTIAHHRLIDDRRRRARRPQRRDEPIEETEEGGAAAPAEERALANLGDEAVTRLLGRLSPDQRDVLVLRIVGDLTVEQVAEAVGKRPGAVKALQRRGLASLRRLIEAGDIP